MRVLLLDNYDSFTYNLAQYAEECGAEVTVKRNDALSVTEALAIGADGILISPGPCTPDKAGISETLITEAAGKTPVLGVCLGMQAIAEVFGGSIVPARRIMHGKSSLVSHDGLGVFADIPSPFSVIRYHSLAVSNLPESLAVTATSDDGETMAIRHTSYDVEGVQFHPESILTEHGRTLTANWLRRL